MQVGDLSLDFGGQAEGLGEERSGFRIYGSAGFRD